MERHCGWEYNDKLFVILLKHIPKARWINAQDKDGCTILHAILHGYMSNEHVTKYLKLFIGLGCDPTVKSTYGTIFLPIAYSANAEMMTIMLDEYKADVNERYVSDNEYPEYDKADTPIFGILRNYSNCKDKVRLNEIKRAIKILIDHGIDLEYMIPLLKMTVINPSNKIFRDGMGCRIYDYMIYYGWVDYLRDILPVPRDICLMRLKFIHILQQMNM